MAQHVDVHWFRRRCCRRRRPSGRQRLRGKRRLRVKQHPNSRWINCPLPFRHLYSLCPTIFFVIGPVLAYSTSRQFFFSSPGVFLHNIRGSVILKNLPKMRELLLTNCELESASNLEDSKSKFAPLDHQTNVIRNNCKHQNFAEKSERISEQRRPSYSFEISPARSEKDFELLVKSAADVVSGGLAAFASVTWHLSERPPPHWPSVPAVRTALGLSQLVGQHGVLLHLSAAGLRRRDVADALAAADGREGACALFIVRGDGCTSGGDFAHAADLVRFVRSLPEGRRRAVGVAGHPLGHPESRSLLEDLLHLREKVQAGADFIISQVVFDAATFLQFVEACRRVGIVVPILAGVPIVTDSGMLGRLCKLCRVPVPEAVLSDLSRGGREAGVQRCVFTCRQLLAAGVDGIHFFTLNNMDNLQEVVQQLPVGDTVQRQCPCHRQLTSRTNC